MRTRLLSALLLSSMLFAAPAAAAEAEAEPEIETTARSETHLPVSISLLPAIGLNGFYGGDVVNNFSLGLIATRAARIEGVALASAVNWVDRGTRGALIAGAANFDGGSTRGLQMAGALNITGGELVGWQIAGAFNLGAGHVTGWQTGGAVNIAGGGFTGWQTAGGVNVSAGPATGLQTAGGLNFAEQLRGAQISVINIGGDVDGAQIGVINIARRARGLQLGVINLASEMEGAPIGVVSLARNGQLHLQGFASDLALTNVALKFGSRHVYTLLTAGVQPGGDGVRHWITGAGIGGHIPFGRFYFDVDVLGSSLREEFIGGGANVLGQLRVIGGWRLADHFAVFAGATANVWTLFDEQNPEKVGLLPGWQVGSDSVQVRMWPGLIAGIEL